jgi:hypothetical protein
LTITPGVTYSMRAGLGSFPNPGQPATGARSGNITIEFVS